MSTPIPNKIQLNFEPAKTVDSTATGASVGALSHANTLGALALLAYKPAKFRVKVAGTDGDGNVELKASGEVIATVPVTAGKANTSVDVDLSSVGGASEINVTTNVTAAGTGNWTVYSDLQVEPFNIIT